MVSILSQDELIYVRNKYNIYRIQIYIFPAIVKEVKQDSRVGDVANFGVRSIDRDLLTDPSNK